MASKKTANTNDVIDISLSTIRKKRFRIDGDNTRILELNTSDLNILGRLKEAYPKLLNLTENAVKNWPSMEEDVENVFESEKTTQVINILEEIDTEMRKLMDYIFDSNVSEICAPYGSMYDPINGGFRFEHIIETLSPLYETDLVGETNKISTRLQKHTSKYVKK